MGEEGTRQKVLSAEPRRFAGREGWSASPSALVGIPLALPSFKAKRFIHGTAHGDSLISGFNQHAVLSWGMDGGRGRWGGGGGWSCTP